MLLLSLLKVDFNEKYSIDNKNLLIILTIIQIYSLMYKEEILFRKKYCKKSQNVHKLKIIIKFFTYYS